MDNEKSLHEFDLAYMDRGIAQLAGVDEAGRGPLAGDVYAAAVILPRDFYIPDINDSKKLTEAKREKLFPIIKQNALAYCIASVGAAVIDEINILQATFLAMRQAVDGLAVLPDYVLIDGNRDPGLSVPGECVVKGDGKSQSIAAASILAKVARDNYMYTMAEKYPQYGFEKHKGYGTKLHVARILEYGACEIHRKTFLKKLVKNG